MPDLRLTRRARYRLQSLPRAIQDAVFETLFLIQLEPEDMGKRLVGRMAGLWAARAGNYRILYTIEQSGVIVRSIRHRGVVNRPQPRRR